jgi:hypothetical protein
MAFVPKDAVKLTRRELPFKGFKDEPFRDLILKSATENGLSCWPLSSDGTFGFICTVFRAAGVELPGSGSAQASCGRIVSSLDSTQWKIGDRIYLGSDGKITSVAIYLGGGGAMYPIARKPYAPVVQSCDKEFAGKIIKVVRADPSEVPSPSPHMAE